MLKENETEITKPAVLVETEHMLGVLPELSRRALIYSSGYFSLPSDVEDAAQQALSKEFHKVGSNKFKIDDLENVLETLSSYLYRTVKNMAIDRSRKVKNITFVPVSKVEYFLPSGGKREVEDVVFNKIATENLEARVNELRDDYRKVLLMRLNGREYKEISEKLGKSEGACRISYHRAVNKLRNEVGVDDIVDKL